MAATFSHQFCTKLLADQNLGWVPSLDRGGFHALHSGGHVTSRNNVVTVKHTASFMPNDLHGYFLRYSRIDQIPNRRAPQIVNSQTIILIPRVFHTTPAASYRF